MTLDSFGQTFLWDARASSTNLHTVTRNNLAWRAWQIRSHNFIHHLLLKIFDWSCFGAGFGKNLVGWCLLAVCQLVHFLHVDVRMIVVLGSYTYIAWMFFEASIEVMSNFNALCKHVQRMRGLRAMKPVINPAANGTKYIISTKTI